MDIGVDISADIEQFAARFWLARLDFDPAAQQPGHADQVVEATEQPIGDAVLARPETARPVADEHFADARRAPGVRADELGGSERVRRMLGEQAL